jgi:peptidoglycan hydrolase FlgJ
MEILSPLQNQGSVFSARAEGKLNQLKNDVASGENKDAEELKELAKQFESVFVNLLMKSMRDTLPKDGLISSHSLDMYQSLFDEEVANEMAKSKGKGVGLANVLYSQLSRMNEEGSDPEQNQKELKPLSPPDRVFNLQESRQ